MGFSLVQYRDGGGRRGVALLRDGEAARPVPGAVSTLELAAEAISRGERLAETVARRGAGAGELDLAALDLLAPVDHPDPAHLLVSGTGLTHLGSAEQRDAMHGAASEGLTDSMRMFRMGLEGGRPAEGETGAQPEWFYKGDGSAIAAPGEPLAAPAFAPQAGEEPELAGIYLIAPDGAPVRLGFALGNEFSDHVTERGNYLWLAHSKLRRAALGPELRIGPLPGHIEGRSRIVRGGATIWEAGFLTGEDNMSHSLANLEHHHFKYAQFRRPGDLHVHFFGTATLSFGAGIEAQPGDLFEIEAPPFRLPVRNPFAVAAAEPFSIRTL